MSSSLNCENCSSFEHSLFNCASKNAIKELAEQKNTHSIKKKSYLFKEGDKVEGFYCLTKGLVRTFRVSNSGREQTFSIKKKGSWIGFKDVYSSETYSSNAISLEDSEACFISKESIDELLEKDTGFQKYIIRYLSQEWKKAEAKLFTIGAKQIHQRLADFLIHFHNPHTKELEFKISREDLASIIGSKSETLIRALSDFKKRSWIELRNNKIKILDINALVSLTNIT
jgi:CRP/FNR family transcriptional regulator